MPTQVRSLQQKKQELRRKSAESIQKLQQIEELVQELQQFGELVDQLQQELLQEEKQAQQNKQSLQEFLIEVENSPTIEEAIETAEHSAIYQQATPETRQWIIEQIKQRFKETNLNILQRFTTKVKNANDRQAARALRESNEYLDAPPQLARLMDEKIEQFHPSQEEKPSFGKRFRTWFMAIGISLLPAAGSFLIDFLGFLGFENIQELKQKYPSLNSTNVLLYLSLPIASLLAVWWGVKRFFWKDASDSSTDPNKGL